VTKESYNFLKLQVKLEKTGRYLYSSFKEVEEKAYSELDGPDYMWGLYFSQIFWNTHHRFTNFFLEDFANLKQNNGVFLEIPSGTGFFLCEFLLKNPEWYGTGIDIGESAVAFSKILLNANKIPKKSYTVLKEDFLKFPENEKFDRIICGEFLEHVEDPLGILKKLNRLLNNDGEVFLTTAVWTAHTDHIYLYKNAEEVRRQISESGFQIKKELVQSIFEKDENDPEKSKIPVSYAAILSKNNQT
jgi:2-polyprenyl-3-methyl-5-hydroxy-6-metoxy-1,4-benzoquinol methylase